MVITFTPATSTPALSDVVSTDRALACRPVGATGRVSQTARWWPLARTERCSAATAVARRWTDAQSSSAAPSMSKSTVVSP
jgi:hypothetical protein